MPLVLDERRVLPVGLHDATLVEIEEVFGTLSTRYKLFENLKRYIEELRRTGWACTLLVDGSFVVESIREPNDIDLVLGHPPEVPELIEQGVLQPYKLNLLSNRHCQKEYKIDIKACVVNSGEYVKWAEFFSQVNPKRSDEHGLPPGSKKGLVRIVL